MYTREHQSIFVWYLQGQAHLSGKDLSSNLLGNTCKFNTGCSQCRRKVGSSVDMTIQKIGKGLGMERLVFLLLFWGLVCFDGWSPFYLMYVRNGLACFWWTWCSQQNAITAGISIGNIDILTWLYFDLNLWDGLGLMWYMDRLIQDFRNLWTMGLDCVSDLNDLCAYWTLDFD